MLLVMQSHMATIANRPRPTNQRCIHTQIVLKCILQSQEVTCRKRRCLLLLTCSLNSALVHLTSHYQHIGHAAHIMLSLYCVNEELLQLQT